MSLLLETTAALAISGAVLVLVTGSLAGSARLHANSFQLTDQLFRARQLEHLIDRAALWAGAGPTHPPPVSALASDAVTFACDHNGDGTIDSSSSEATAVEIRQFGSQTRVRIRFGGQTMTVLEADQSDALLSAFDRFGDNATATSAALFELRLTARDNAQSPRRLLFSVPARTWP